MQNHTTAHRERSLLFIAAVFFLVGALVLVISNPQLSPAILLFPLLAWVAAFAAAHLFLNRYLPRRDPFLLPVGALLTGWGFLCIERLASNFIIRQTTWLLVSVVALLAVVRLGRDLRWLRRFRYTWLLGGLALLAATLLFGVNPSGYGQRLWLGGWGIYFQPSEPLKLLMIVYLASYLAERKGLLAPKKIGRWRLPSLAYVGPLLVMFGLTIVLLAWQQDLGAAMLFFFTFLAMLYLATGQWGYIAAGLALFAAAGLAGYNFSDRVALRVDGWLDPWPEAAGRAFQIVQSLLAFGAGGILGRGLGMGSPTYIPAVHTDFVFAAIGEEFGLAGTLVILALYGILTLRGFCIAARATRPFERFLAAGLTVALAVQAWVIMAGNVKLAPIAGVTLPFVSYGGSSILTSFIALGLLLRVSGGDKTSFPHPTVHLPPPSVPASLFHLASVLAVAFLLLALTCGYWAVVKAAPLRARADNPRRVLYEQRVVRGRILDRDGVVLADVQVAGDGTVSRRYLVPEAAPPLGYASLRYGTGGIEAAFDRELRGEVGRSAWQAALDDLLHRAPQGRDVQLTLDAALQIQAQRALQGQAGAIVLLDPASGDILALASSPTFVPQLLDEMWDELRADPAAPLLNRATQGLYQPGAAFQTVVVAEALREEVAGLDAPAPGATATMSVDGATLGCTAPLSAPYTLARAYGAACPAPFADLGERLGAAGLASGVERWALTTPPPLEIPTAATDWGAGTLTTTSSLQNEAIGQGALTVSPLQMALVAGTLSNRGKMPAPRLALRVQDAMGAWRDSRPAGEPRAVILPGEADRLLASWRRYGEVAAHWGTAAAGEGQPPHAWFLGVAPADSPRYSVALILEHPADPEAVVATGAALLQAALAP